MKKATLGAAALGVVALSALAMPAQANSSYGHVSYSWDGGYVATVHVPEALPGELVVQGASWREDNPGTLFPQTLLSEAAPLVVKAGETGDFTVVVPMDNGCGQRDLYAGGYHFVIPGHLSGPGDSAQPKLAQTYFPGNSNSWRVDTSACSTPTPTASVTPSTTPVSTPSPTATSTPSPSTTPSVTPSSTTSSSTAPSVSPSTPRPTATLLPPIRISRTPKPSSTSAGSPSSRPTSATPSSSSTVSASSSPSTTPSRSSQVHGIPSGPADTGTGSSGHPGWEYLGFGCLFLSLSGLLLAWKRHA